MKPETRFSIRFAGRMRELARANAGRMWFSKIQQVSISGTPDYLMCVDGLFVAVELKVPGGRVSRLQSHTLAAIERAGGVALVLMPSALDDFCTYVAGLLAGAPVSSRFIR